MTGLISVEEALRLISAHPIPRKVETVKLNRAIGRTLAAPIIAKTTRPPVPVSAMDGYAVQLKDVLNAGAKLHVIGDAPAGQPFLGEVTSGQAVRIFTGGEVPSGTDHIVIQENVTRTGTMIIVSEASSKARFIRTAGLDFSEGDMLVSAGTHIGAMELSIAAAANLGTLDVNKRPRVGILANGNELKPPGSDLAPGQIVNSNPSALAALMEAWGAEAVDLGIAGDSVQSIQDHINAIPDIDIYLPIGGASVGDHDHMRAAFSGLGFKPIFEKIAVKPGKPTWFSQREDQRVLGLPGNPASTLVCAHLFAAPLVSSRQMPSNKASTLKAIPANGPREQFLRAVATLSSEGQLCVQAAPNQDSSLLRPFLACNALIRRKPKAPTSPQGEFVDVLLIGPLAAQ